MTVANFLKSRPHLLWYVADKSKVSAGAAVEAVLNYGDWDDVQAMIKILGLKKTAKIFREKSRPDKFGRQNYRPEIKNYFQLYFNKYA